MTVTAPKTASAGPAGRAYVGRIDDLHQSVSLQVRPDASVRLVLMYALHTPPAMVEEYEGQMVERESGWCLTPAPKSFQPCFDLTAEQATLTRVSGERVDLRYIER
ncbi:MAG: hypothetical protein ACJ8GV_06360 [Luteimonas sp.]